MSKSKRKLSKRLRKQRNRGNHRKQSKGRTPGRNHHHLQNKCKGGGTSPGNLLLIDIERHRCWHTLFKNKNLDQVIEFLLRVRRFKQGQRR